MSTGVSLGAPELFTPGGRSIGSPWFKLMRMIVGAGVGAGCTTMTVVGLKVGHCVPV